MNQQWQEPTHLRGIRELMERQDAMSLKHMVGLQNDFATQAKHALQCAKQTQSFSAGLAAQEILTRMEQTIKDAACMSGLANGCIQESLKHACEPNQMIADANGHAQRALEMGQAIDQSTLLGMRVAQQAIESMEHISRSSVAQTIESVESSLRRFESLVGNQQAFSAGPLIKSGFNPNRYIESLTAQLAAQGYAEMAASIPRAFARMDPAVRIGPQPRARKHGSRTQKRRTVRARGANQRELEQYRALWLKESRLVIQEEVLALREEVSAGREEVRALRDDIAGLQDTNRALQEQVLAFRTQKPARFATYVYPWLVGFAFALMAPAVETAEATAKHWIEELTAATPAPSAPPSEHHVINRVEAANLSQKPPTRSNTVDFTKPRAATRVSKNFVKRQSVFTDKILTPVRSPALVSAKVSGTVK